MIDEIPSLTNTNCYYASLPYIDLSHRNLSGSNFEDANLMRANLEDANLEFANLKDANLSGANLENANLRGANLMRSDLKDANLRGANLDYADMEDANLTGADLTNTKLIYPYLDFAAPYLEGANLKGVKTNDVEVQALIDDHVSLCENAIRERKKKNILDELEERQEMERKEMNRKYRNILVGIITFFAAVAAVFAFGCDDGYYDDTETDAAVEVDAGEDAGESLLPGNVEIVNEIYKQTVDKFISNADFKHFAIMNADNYKEESSIVISYDDNSNVGIKAVIIKTASSYLYISDLQKMKALENNEFKVISNVDWTLKQYQYLLSLTEKDTECFVLFEDEDSKIEPLPDNVKVINDIPDKAVMAYCKNLSIFDSVTLLEDTVFNIKVIGSRAGYAVDALVIPLIDGGYLYIDDLQGLVQTGTEDEYKVFSNVKWTQKEFVYYNENTTVNYMCYVIVHPIEVKFPIDLEILTEKPEPRAGFKYTKRTIESFGYGSMHVGIGGKQHTFERLDYENTSGVLIIDVSLPNDPMYLKIMASSDGDTYSWWYNLYEDWNQNQYDYLLYLIKSRINTLKPEVDISIKI